MRKQKHLDDLMTQVAQLRKENHQLITSINITSQHYLNVEADNSILKAQISELSHRLQSLNEIISFLSASNGVYGDSSSFDEPADSFLNPLNMPYLNHPIMASADIFQYQIKTHLQIIETPAREREIENAHVASEAQETYYYWALVKN